MYRICSRAPRVAFTFLLLRENINDRVADELKPAVDSSETGWDRVRKIFQPAEFGGWTQEAIVISQSTLMGSFIGMCYGGFIYSKDAYLEFMRNNQATSFTNHMDAKKKLQHKVTMGFAKGAFRWGWRLSAFTLIYIGISVTMSAYRGKNGIIEHMLGAGTAGFLYNWNRGPRSWLIGTGLGLLLGTVGGTSTWLFLKLTGLSLHDVQYYNYKWANLRKEAVDENFRHYREKEDFELVKERTARKDVVPFEKLAVGSSNEKTDAVVQNK